jgi:hypothetical protein
MDNADIELETRWKSLLIKLKEVVGKRPADLNGVLFLIGVQELGQGVKNFTKEQKQDLMHIAICKVMSLSGYYELEKIDEQGWPHWKLIKPLPHLDLLAQEKLLKSNVLNYFNQESQL